MLLACGQRFRGPLRDETSFNLCGHGKGHRHDLALDTVVELPIAFDSVDTDALLHSQGEDFHTLQHAAAQMGQFANDDSIAFLRILQNGGDLPLAPGDLTGDFLFDERDMPQVRLVGKLQNARFVLF